MQGLAGPELERAQAASIGQSLSLPPDEVALRASLLSDESTLAQLPETLPGASSKAKDATRRLLRLTAAWGRRGRSTHCIRHAKAVKDVREGPFMLLGAEPCQAT